MQSTSVFNVRKGKISVCMVTLWMGVFAVKANGCETNGNICDDIRFSTTDIFDIIRTSETLKHFKIYSQINGSNLQSSNNKSRVKTIRRPPPLSILMNFQNDGTTSMQIYDKHNVYWTDNGLCKHGQIFDPNVNMCRHVFCTEGYTHTKTGCEVDTKHGSIKRPIAHNTNEYELTILNLLSVHSKLDNITKYVNSPLMAATDLFLVEFQLSLSRYFKINRDRIHTIRIISNDSIVDTFIYPFFVSDLSQIKNIDALNQHKGSIKQTLERIRLTFTIKDNMDFADDDDSQLFVQLAYFKLNTEFMRHELFDREVAIANVTEIRSTIEWCSEKGDEKLAVADNGFTLVPGFDDDQNLNKYFIYLNTTQMLYKTGEYILSINYVQKSDTVNKNGGATAPMVVADDDDDANQSLIALSKIVFGKNFFYTNMTLTVCNRVPKIRVNCMDHKTMRIKACELEMYANRTLCYTQANTCYSIDEYEYDQSAAKGHEYIRVCSIANNETHADANISVVYSKSATPSTLSGYISFLVNTISLIAMILTLITYALFKSLRNIPGKIARFYLCSLMVDLLSEIWRKGLQMCKNRP
jgi:hypothetical protein